MEKNTTTTVENLKPGDRFYKVSDKTKKVFQIVEHEVKKTHFQTYRYWCIPATVADNMQMKSEKKEMYATPIKRDRQVVFLRNVNE